MRSTLSLIVLLHLLGISRFACCQNLLYVHTHSPSALYLVDLDRCKATFIGSFPELMYDIALSPGGQMYGVSATGKLYEIDKATGKLTFVADTPAVMNALVYGPDNFLYSANAFGNVFKIDPGNKSFISLGNCGFGSGGDLTFYEGQLYMASAQSELIKLTLSNPIKADNLGYLGIPGVLGIITVGSPDCQGAKPKMYATSNNTIYGIDLKSNKPVLSNPCSLPISYIGGAASPVEGLTSKKKEAGEDSLVSVCYKSPLKEKLNNYLPSIDPTGKWIDLDNSGSLSDGLVDVTRLQEKTYRFQYILGESLCADTAIISMVVKPLYVKSLVLKRPGCINEEGEIEIIMPSSYVNSQYAINSQAYQSSNTFRNLKADTYLLKIRTVDGCEGDTIVKLSQTVAPVLSSITSKNPTCGIDNGIIEVYSTSTVTPLLYSINGLPYQGESVFKQVSAGKYTVAIKDTNGCSASKDIELLQTYGPTITATEVRSTSCGQKNGSIKIVAEKGLLPLKFSVDSTNFQRDNMFPGLSAGSYRAFVSDALGCTVAVSVRVDSSAAISLAAVKTTPTDCNEANGKIAIDAVGNGPFSYSISSGLVQKNSVFDNLPGGRYEVVVTDLKGCRASTNAIVNATCIEAIYFPNSFTPNNDRLNDTWVAYSQQKEVEVIRCSIYNRWGEIIYEKTNFKLGNGETLWNGLVNDKLATGNLFNYVVEARFISGKSYTYSGSVHLLN